MTIPGQDWSAFTGKPFTDFMVKLVAFKALVKLVASKVGFLQIGFFDLTTTPSSYLMLPKTNN